MSEKHGISGRDGVWAHPDLLPDAEDLDDPLGFADKVGADALGELPREADGGATDTPPDQPR